MIAENHFTAVAALDLEPIKNKLMAVPGAAWSAEKTAAVERDYRRFLQRMKMFPNEEAAPAADVDRFWRLHILETRRYADDCEKVFGYFLHRSPSLQPPGAGQETVQRRCSDRVTAR